MKTLALLALIFTPISLKYFPLPYLWIGLAWTCVFLLMAKKARRTAISAFSLQLAVVALFLSGTEIYFWHTHAASNEKLVGNYWTPEMFQKDPILGYVPKKNAVDVKGERYVDDKLVFAMSINTDQHGFRQTAAQPSGAQEAILFFGCSFTFGVGLNDQDTLPYQVATKLNGRVKTYNFAYGGYGPQQMLNALEQGLVEKVVTEKPKQAFYVAIPSHISRSAGLTSWNINDPKFELDEKGQIYLAGHFNDQIASKPKWLQLCYSQLGKSYLWQKIQAARQPELQARDIERYIQMVIKAKNTFLQRYPDAEFHIIYWEVKDVPNADAVTKQLLQAFAASHIPVHRVNSIIPDFQQSPHLYSIANDGHPNARANERIAAYVVEVAEG